MGRRCMVCGYRCTPFFQVPSDFQLRFKWLESLEGHCDTSKIKEYSVICRNHFQEDDFSSATKTIRLVKGAVPTIFDFAWQSNRVQKKPPSDMGRTCSVPNCKSGYCGYDDKVSIFSLPKDRDTVSKWRAVFEEIGKTVNSYTFVCEKHFSQDDIATKWSNGVIKVHFTEDQFELKRADGKKKLKWNAVPTLFTPQELTTLKNFKIDYKRKKLRKGAVPVISPEYLQEVDKTRRNRTHKRKSSDTVSIQPSKALKYIEVFSAHTIEVAEPEAIFIAESSVSVKEEPVDASTDSLVDPLLISIKQEI